MTERSMPRLCAYCFLIVVVMATVAMVTMETIIIGPYIMYPQVLFEERNTIFDRDVTGQTSCVIHRYFMLIMLISMLISKYIN